MTITSAIGKLRIVIADDHPVVREGVAAIINRQSDMSVVAEAADGRGAIEATLRERPDVALLDLRMPRVSGLEAIREIRRLMPTTRILVLTTFEGDEDVYSALREGAQGYLLKDLSSTELLTAIRAAAAGLRVLPGRAAERLAERVSESELTTRERVVLKELVSGNSNRGIAESLSITEGTVKGHLKQIFLKLRVADRTAAAMAALRRGFIHVDELRRTRSSD
jgi:two-component system NarL family response regulator